jgi:hypothetical protein
MTAAFKNHTLHRVMQTMLSLLLTKKAAVFVVHTDCLTAVKLDMTSGGVVQLVRTSACHAEGREFESRRSRHIIYAVAWQRFSF